IATLLNSIALPASAPQRLQKIISCARLGRNLGLGSETLKLIISDDADELALAEIAVLGALRLVYPNDKEWQAKTEPIEDELRSSKRDILIDFVLQLSQLGRAGFAELNSEKALYDFFLIDVELGGCARTSRLVAAISSVQLYIQRLLMNLERIALSNNATTAAHMAQEWEWRKNYRVWEANRKVFLYPENYIEPDLRDDKTPLFRELEDTLLQQEINQQHVLDAYAAYLNGFEQVARLKIVGSYHDNREQGDILHLFGVTQDNPPVYYYRAVKNAIHAEIDPDTYGIDWSYWRKVDVQIPVARVAPIVYQGRLYVFWVEITTTPKNDVTGGQSTFVGYKHKMSLKYTSL
ncbi:MAG TPA: neuraminidase-like domain-containing protein, partial [Nitrososphaera sp.]|nr:neuraminidase-like domain-containing protein [Nitrososphaera sp.]